jgi:hypothetical protein
MERRNFLKWSSLLSTLGLLPSSNVLASTTMVSHQKATTGIQDRAYWVALLDKIATPVLANMSKGELKLNMKLATSSTWDNRNTQVAYMEAFGRLLVGIAPFLDLPDDLSSNESKKETKVRNRLKKQSLQSLTNAVDPTNADYLYWGTPKDKQPLVDAAFIAQALLTAPKTLWEPLSQKTKENFIKEFTLIRQIEPSNNNWVLFAAMIESFLLFIDQPFDAARIDKAISKIASWYVGDGWYSDGEKFHFDHYNGYVIQPMLVEVLRINVLKKRIASKDYDLAYKRMQRYASFQERYISPEGTFLVVGRSSTYRVGAFQPLAKLALDNQLPAPIEPAQVRCALTAVFKNIFIPSTFTKDGWLTLGLVGDKQADIADYYSNTGSMYLTSLAFLPLGLGADQAFWSNPYTSWTQKKAWSGEPFEKDYAVDY